MPEIEKQTVVIDEHGAFVGKTSERLTVKLDKKIFAEYPFFRIREVIISGKGVSVSTDILLELSESGIPVSFIDSMGKPYGMFSSPALNATVKTRRAQLEAFNDERGAVIARGLVRGKMKNQASLLLYFGKYLKGKDASRFELVKNAAASISALAVKAGKVEGKNSDEVRNAVMGSEGNAATRYWEAVKTLLAGKTEFQRREHRGAADPVNAALNYGYGILYSRVWGAVLNAGLEPFAGFLHVDRPGKPSMVLDMVEEFRQPVVDRAVIGLFTKGGGIDFEDEGGLTLKSRKELAERVMERLNAEHPYNGARFTMHSIIQAQARRVAAVLRGEEKMYKPFSFKW